MGFVVLSPIETCRGFEVAQVALGDAHTMMLDTDGQVYSCGWHELGQLGISNAQREKDLSEGKTWHEVQL